MGELELGDAASSAARALFRGKTTQGGAPCLVTDPVFFCACDERCGESRGGRGGGACLCLCLCLENYCAVLTARFLLPAACCVLCVCAVCAVCAVPRLPAAPRLPACACPACTDAGQLQEAKPTHRRKATTRSKANAETQGNYKKQSQRTDARQLQKAKPTHRRRATTRSKANAETQGNNKKQSQRRDARQQSRPLEVQFIFCLVGGYSGASSAIDHLPIYHFSRQVLSWLRRHRKAIWASGSQRPIAGVFRQDLSKYSPI